MTLARFTPALIWHDELAKHPSLASGLNQKETPSIGEDHLSTREANISPWDTSGLLLSSA